MTNRPDYDVGDLVVCVRVKNGPRKTGFVVGAVYIVTGLKLGGHAITGERTWGASFKGLDGWWTASAFRRIDPKPPEFWTGYIEAIHEEGVTA